MANFVEEKAIEYDELIAGASVPLRTKNVKISITENLKRGTLLTNEGNDTVALCADPGTASFVLAQDVEAAEGEQVVTVYVSGEFNADKCIVAAGEVDAQEENLRQVGILLAHSVGNEEDED